ncbi:hypothetical protein O59_002257 [Cellvibrio sp. BR]|uniref:hypothetical protein n=1 Tax=unclassified Cellvibrio TaxID=2624793 RepID=UPI0002600BC6|nr:MULTISPECIES: hypothetical protein [unclassified Cellvibrio]EIK45579.1 hypothetical protein O59_002257 [Cellvibrio sp. BR]UUA72996.1 hypothetical protein NNX04_00755 [Cellvibrio sp. QJXJ]
MIPKPLSHDEYTIGDSASWVKIEYESFIDPAKYLSFSKKDLEIEKSERTFINAISNAKRALHLQVETISKAFGFKSRKSKNNVNFHDHLEYCEKCGVLTPKILKSINKIRNAVEHDYYIPTEVETEEFIDIIELFLAATDKYVCQFPESLDIAVSSASKNNHPALDKISLEPYTGEIKLQLCIFEPSDEDLQSIESYKIYLEKNCLTIPSSNEEYFLWIKLLISKFREW